MLINIIVLRKLKSQVQNFSESQIDELSHKISFENIIFGEPIKLSW